MSILLYPEATSLKSRLSQSIKGEVRFNDGDRSLYATDASNYRQLPTGVVIPQDKVDIIATINICREMNVPIVNRGGGTSLSGQTTNQAVVLDMTKYYHHVLEVNPEEKWIRVQPGIVLDALNKSLEEHGLIVGPDPATHTHCSVGGMLGNNACGVHAQWGGKMQDNTLELEVMTYEGDVFSVCETDHRNLDEILKKDDAKARIYRELLKLRKKYQDQIRKEFPQIPRRVSGLNLEELLEENNFNIARALVGSECTLVTILEAKIRLLEKPKQRVLLVIGYPNIHVAGDDIKELVKWEPMGLEAVDELLKLYVDEKKLHPEGIGCLPEGHSFLLLEFGGQTKEEAEEIAKKCSQEVQKRTEQPDDHFLILTNVEDQEKLWKVRESGLGATARGFNNQSAWPGWEDAAIAPEEVGNYLKDFHKLLKKYDYKGALYGHFGQGCIHTRINFDLKTHGGVEKYRRFIHEAAHLVKQYNGSLSGEHGDGQSRGELLKIMYSPEIIQAMEEFKKIWDPRNMMNPGKVIFSDSATDNLRFGENHQVYSPETHFSFATDNGSFELATERCVGVGKCRQLEGGTMCPSFMVTHEEKHSTRGRAHLLFEMLKKDTLLKPWKEEAVKESLDLCLACKGCKSDCPVSVDMATYKAEFLSHYYEGKMRPIAAFTMGLIFFWNRIASKAPLLVNFLTQTFPFSALFKWIGGISQKRKIPVYAKKTFRDIYKESNQQGQEVIIWVDSFNNYFHPDVLVALTNSLEYCGYRVKLPKKNLCCGRPLYDFGMLKMAKKFLQEIMDSLHEDIVKGTPILIAEPSCLSVFQDELINFFPNDLNAKRLSEQCFTLSQFIEKNDIVFELPKTAEQKIKVHGHCHYKSLNDMGPDTNFLGRFSEAQQLETGCCGMAGAFGFEKGEKYEVSIKMGEHDLIPKIKESEGDLIVADGFSCREQVKHMLGHYPLHSAQVMAQAIRKQD
jgi:FAD/FMN-containing dehydrogenase/Fe-S oxidoreductase